MDAEYSTLSTLGRSCWFRVSVPWRNCERTMHPVRPSEVAITSVMCVCVLILCVRAAGDQPTTERTDNTTTTSSTTARTTVLVAKPKTPPITITMELVLEEKRRATENHLWKKAMVTEFWYSPLVALSICVAIVVALYIGVYYLT